LVGEKLGFFNGLLLGTNVGDSLGSKVVGDRLGRFVGLLVGLKVGDTLVIM